MTAERIPILSNQKYTSDVVYFEIPLNTIIYNKGEKSMVTINGSCEKLACTIILCIKRDGWKLPTYVIFLRKSIPKITMSRIVLTANEKG